MSSRLVVLDVGHGNCSIIEDDRVVCVIDAGRGPYASIYLEQAGIKEISLIVISHTDDDHLGGIIGILSSEKFKVREVAINADAAKDTKIWRDVRALIQSKFNEGKISLKIGVFQGKLNWPASQITLEVLSPSAYGVLGGVGSTDEAGNRITSNSGSIVLRVAHPTGSRALLAADMEESTLHQILGSGLDATAPILVYPHHGGRPGSGSTTEFAERIIAAVRPTTVVFSNGREKHGNPRPEVMHHVCGAGIGRIACTQISKNCHSTAVKQSIVSLPFSAGADDGRSCAGTIEFNLESGEADSERNELHQRFIDGLDTPMCRATNMKVSADPVGIH